MSWSDVRSKVKSEIILFLTESKTKQFVEELKPECGPNKSLVQSN